MKKSPKFRYLTYMIMLLCFYIGQAQFVFDSKQIEHQSLHTHASIFKDESTQLKIQQVSQLETKQFTPLIVENTDLGFTTANYWIKFSLRNDRKQSISYYLETSRPIVDVANLYEFEKGKLIQIQKSGDNIPVNTKSVKQRKTLFNIDLQPGEAHDYFLQLGSDGEVINAPLVLHSANDLMDESSYEQIVFGFFYGMLMLSAVIYLFFSLR